MHFQIPLFGMKCTNGDKTIMKHKIGRADYSAELPLPDLKLSIIF